jgi:hypothetical protein
MGPKTSDSAAPCNLKNAGFKTLLLSVVMTEVRGCGFDIDIKYS